MTGLPILTNANGVVDYSAGFSETWESGPAEGNEPLVGLRGRLDTTWSRSRYQAQRFVRNPSGVESARSPKSPRVPQARWAWYPIKAPFPMNLLATHTTQLDPDKSWLARFNANGVADNSPGFSEPWESSRIKGTEPQRGSASGPNRRASGIMPASRTQPFQGCCVIGAGVPRVREPWAVFRKPVGLGVQTGHHFS